MVFVEDAVCLVQKIAASIKNISFLILVSKHNGIPESDTGMRLPLELTNV